MKCSECDIFFSKEENVLVCFGNQKIRLFNEKHCAKCAKKKFNQIISDNLALLETFIIIENEEVKVSWKMFFIMLNIIKNQSGRDEENFNIVWLDFIEFFFLTGIISEDHVGNWTFKDSNLIIRQGERIFFFKKKEDILNYLLFKFKHNIVGIEIFQG